MDLPNIDAQVAKKHWYGDVVGLLEDRVRPLKGRLEGIQDISGRGQQRLLRSLGTAGLLGGGLLAGAGLLEHFGE